MVSVYGANRRKLIKSNKNQADMNTWKRLVLGIFVFACLNVTAQPCLMAMDMAPPMETADNHSPPADHHDHSIHNEDDSAQGGCDHCSTSDGAYSRTCLTNSASGCETLAAISHEGRQFKSKLKDLSQLVVMPALPMAQEFFPDITLLPLPGVEPDKHTREPTLNIRYCVFLI